MDRRDAIESLAHLAPAVVPLAVAHEIAAGVDTDALLYVRTHAERVVGSVQKKDGTIAAAVAVSRLGAEIALHFGLYGSLDHAMAVPFPEQWDRTRSQKYIGERAAMRLAYHWWGREGIAWLRDRTPQLDPLVLAEAIKDPFFARTAHPGRTPTGGS